MNLRKNYEIETSLFLITCKEQFLFFIFGIDYYNLKLDKSFLTR